MGVSGIHYYMLSGVWIMDCYQIVWLTLSKHPGLALRGTLVLHVSFIAVILLLPRSKTVLARSHQTAKKIACTKGGKGEKNGVTRETLYRCMVLN
jgi:hypothetical protein